MLTYAAQLRGLLADYDTPMRLIWEMWDKTTIPTDNGPRKVLMVTEARPGQRPLVTHWGGVSLMRDSTATLVDKQPPILNGRTEIVQWCSTSEQRPILAVSALNSNEVD